MIINTRAHKYEDPFNIFVPALNRLIVLFLCDFGVEGE